MDYFFVLGGHPALSLSELAAKIPGRWRVINDCLAALDGAAELPSDLLEKLGGTVKFGLIIGKTQQLDETVIKQVAERILKLAPADKKICFGLSNYDQRPIKRDFGINIKRQLQQSGRPVRWVISRDPALSSVVVEQNHLISEGGEAVFWRQANTWHWGLTLAVQPFKSLSARDYGRPARDDQSGMLPPKVAQMMLNLAGLEPGDSVMDPFCGSGTVLQEAALMGAGQVIGLDNSETAVINSQTNWQWLIDRWTVNSQIDIVLADARKASQVIDQPIIKRIVTEPYLGPQRGRRDFAAITTELSQLYSQALADWRQIIAPDGRVVMIWPVFMDGQRKYFIRPNINGWREIEYDLLARQTWPKQYTPNGQLLYGRLGQTVWRAIVGLEPV